MGAGEVVDVALCTGAVGQGVPRGALRWGGGGGLGLAPAKTP